MIVKLVWFRLLNLNQNIMSKLLQIRDQNRKFKIKILEIYYVEEFQTEIEQGMTISASGLKMVCWREISTVV